MLATKNEEVLQILEFMDEHKSTKTTQQMFRHFDKNDLLDSLVYAFPFMHTGNILAFESLMSKDVVFNRHTDRPELMDKDIIEDMLGRNNY